MVYLTSSHEVALAYGAIPGQEYVRTHREGAPMTFMAAGVVLTLDSDQVSPRTLHVHEMTAKILDEVLGSRVRVANGPIPSSALTGVDFVFYDKIVGDESVQIVDAKLQVIENRHPRTAGKIKAALGNAAFAVQEMYPQLKVDTIESDLRPDEAVTIFERT